MIDTKRSTRGNIITVLKYNLYQDLQTYKSTRESTSKAREKHERSTPISNNDINERMINNNTLVEKIVSWAYERARGTPSCNKDAFRKSVLTAIGRCGESKVESAFELEENAITFLQNIKNL